MSAEVSAWLARAVADAEARKLPELAPLLEALANSLEALRAADAEFHHPAIGDPPSASGGDAPGPDASSHEPAT